MNGPDPTPSPPTPIPNAVVPSISLQLKRIAFGWSEGGAAKMARIIIRRNLWSLPPTRGLNQKSQIKNQKFTLSFLDAMRLML
jgi:hypothetical protein